MCARTVPNLSAQLAIIDCCFFARGFISVCDPARSPAMFCVWGGSQEMDLSRTAPFQGTISQMEGVI